MCFFVLVKEEFIRRIKINSTKTKHHVFGGQTVRIYSFSLLCDSVFFASLLLLLLLLLLLGELKKYNNSIVVEGEF